MVDIASGCESGALRCHGKNPPFLASVSVAHWTRDRCWCRPVRLPDEERFGRSGRESHAPGRPAVKSHGCGEGLLVASPGRCLPGMWSMPAGCSTPVPRSCGSRACSGRLLGFQLALEREAPSHTREATSAAHTSPLCATPNSRVPVWWRRCSPPATPLPCASIFRRARKRGASGSYRCVFRGPSRADTSPILYCGRGRRRRCGRCVGARRGHGTFATFSTAAHWRRG